MNRKTIASTAGIVVLIGIAMLGALKLAPVKQAGMMPLVGLIKAVDHGVVADGATNNLAALRTAINAACAAGEQLQLPPGTIKVEFSAADPWIEITGNLDMFGEGRHTIIDLHPKQVSTFAYNLLYSDQHNRRVSLSSFHVLGPTSSTTSHLDLTKNVSLLKIIPTGAGGRTDIAVRDVSIYGPAMTNGVTSSNGDGLTEIDHCDFDLLSVCVSSFDNNGVTGRAVHVRDSRFKSGLPGTVTSDGDAFGGALYVHPHVSLLCTNTIFEACHKVAARQYGQAAVGTPPRYSIYSACVFRDCPDTVILTPGERCLTEISGCTWNAGKVQARNQTVISGCGLTATAGIASSTTPQDSVIELRISGNLFDLAGDKVCVTTGANTRLAFSGNSLTYGDYSTAITPVELNNAFSTEVTGNRFHSRSTASPPKAAVRFGGTGQHKATGNTFEGTFATAAIDAFPGGTLEISNNDFSRLTNSRSINFTGTGTISGGGNLFNDKKGTGASVAFIRNRQDLALSSVASAGTVRLGWNYGVFRVTGTTAISTLEIGPSDGNQASKFAASVTLIADGTWSLSSTGNVRPKHTNPRTVGDMVTLFQDPRDGLWLEK